MFDFLETTAPAPLIIAIVGTATMLLASLERLVSARGEAGRSKLRLVLIYIVVTLTMVINVGMHWFQFENVTTTAARERKGFEHEIALSLWAYTDKNVVALKYLAENHKYLLGYHYFRAKQYALAQRAFDEAIDSGSFVGPSHYILAVMARLKNDFEEGRRQLDAAIAYDAEYSSAFLERGLIAALEGRSAAALVDIRKAVAMSSVHCYSVNQSALPDHPLHVMGGEPGFQKLRSYCEELERDM